MKKHKEKDKGGVVVTYGKKRQPSDKRDFEPPPVGKWYPARFVRATARNGSWGPFYTLAFAPVERSMKKIGWQWALMNGNLSYDSKLYEWLCVLAGEKLRLSKGLRIDLEDYYGALVEVRCEERDDTDEDGNALYRVAKIRPRKRPRVPDEPRPTKRKKPKGQRQFEDRVAEQGGVPF